METSQLWVGGVSILVEVSRSGESWLGQGQGKSQPHRKQTEHLCMLHPTLNLYTISHQHFHLLRLTPVASFNSRVLNQNIKRRPFTPVNCKHCSCLGEKSSHSFSLFPPLHHHNPESSNDEHILRAYYVLTGDDEETLQGNTPLDKHQCASG